MKHNEGATISSNDASGGILTLWDTTCVEEEVTFCSQNWILSVLRCKETGIKVSIINVYMPVQYMEKIGCWNSLFVVKENIDLSTYIVASDFNIILHNSEKKKEGEALSVILCGKEWRI
jgi:hypothetical protein